MAEGTTIYGAVNGVLNSDNVFSTLNALDVNEHTEKKKSGMTSLTYLSWPWAWAEVKKRYPDASYEVERFNNLPYTYDPLTGYMVFTKVTINGITHEMWLPCMDANNRAMKAEPYQLTFNNGKSITVAAATMFDINKTMMRCLVKNLAMFGLGLYIYAGEDLPESDDTAPEPQKAATKPATKSTTRTATKPAPKATAKPAQRTGGTTPIKDVVKQVLDYVDRHNMADTSRQAIAKYYGCSGLEEMSEENAKDYIAKLAKNGGNIDE